MKKVKEKPQPDPARLKLGWAWVCLEPAWPINIP